jgi:hypothetical protein
MASRRMAVNSGEAVFKASTFAAWFAVSNPRGLRHSDAATIGVIVQPVVGSMIRGAGAIAGCCFDSALGSSVTADETLTSPTRRHFASSLSKWEKLPV